MFVSFCPVNYDFSCSACIWVEILSPSSPTLSGLQSVLCSEVPSDYSVHLRSLFVLYVRLCEVCPFIWFSDVHFTICSFYLLISAVFLCFECAVVSNSCGCPPEPAACSTCSEAAPGHWPSLRPSGLLWWLSRLSGMATCIQTSGPAASLWCLWSALLLSSCPHRYVILYWKSNYPPASGTLLEI